MFKSAKNKKDYINSNDLITKGMLKRRRLALAAISCVCDNVQKLRVVK